MVLLFHQTIINLSFAFGSFVKLMNNNRDNNFKTILFGKLLVVSKNEMSMVNLEKNWLVKDYHLKFVVKYLKKKKKNIMRRSIGNIYIYIYIYIHNKFDTY